MSYLHFFSCNLRYFTQVEGKCIILMLSCYRLSTLGCPSLIMMSTAILLFSTLLGLYQQRELLWGKHYLKKIYTCDPCWFTLVYLSQVVQFGTLTNVWMFQKKISLMWFPWWRTLNENCCVIPSRLTPKLRLIMNWIFASREARQKTPIREWVWCMTRIRRGKPDEP